MNVSLPLAPAAADRPSITLLGLEYEPLPTPFRGAATLRETVNALGEAVGCAARSFQQALGTDVDEYAIGSTLNSPYTSDPSMWRDAYRSRIAQYAGLSPDYSVNVYECTNWAFILRNSLSKSRAQGSPRRVLMQIVDADIHGMQIAWKTRTYGFARFGILTAALSVDGTAATPSVSIRRAPVDHAMIKFGSAIRHAASASPTAKLCLPFFPQPTREAFRRCVANCDGLPDLHDEYGHCFGADPWIALGLHRQQEPVGSRQYLVGSLALNGYHAIGNVAVAEDARARIGRPS